VWLLTEHCSRSCARITDWGEGKYTEEWHKKVSEAKKGKNHPLWKGEDVGYNALHAWIHRNIELDNKCFNCGTTESKLELANKTGIYDRNFENWFILCIDCHRKYDGKYNRGNRSKYYFI